MRVTVLVLRIVIKILYALKITKQHCFILKITKGHNSVENVGGFMVLNNCTSANHALLFTRFAKHLKGFRVIERTRFLQK